MAEFSMISKYLNGSLGRTKFIAGQNIDILSNVSELVIQLRQSWRLRSELPDQVFGRVRLD